MADEGCRHLSSNACLYMAGIAEAFRGFRCKCMASRFQDRVADSGLFLVLVIVINSLLGPWPPAPSQLIAGFTLAMLPHVAVTAWDGRLGPWRRTTWLLLILAWVLSELTVFIGDILPWGQIGLWLANLAEERPGLGKVLQAAFDSPGAALLPPLLLLVLLGLDLASMHGPRWRARPIRQLAVFLVAAAAAAILLGLALGMLLLAPIADAAAQPLDLYPVLPPWHVWPFIALLRAVPDKLIGVLLVFAVVLAPMAWPWLRAERLRGAWARHIWPWLCLAFIAAWIGLGYLGGQAPIGAALWAPLPLAAFHLAFFLLLPWLLGRNADRGA